MISANLNWIISYPCRAEAAARTSAQDAVDEAEKRARLAREEHERSTNELDKQMAAAKVG